MKIELVPLTDAGRENFIAEIQRAFKVAFVEEFGDTLDEVIPREDVIESFNAEGAESYNILCDGENVGGAVLKIRADNQNELLLFFIKVGSQSRGLGSAAWKAIENLHPETKIWETFTPYFEKRNIHFYVNKCGFRIVEFFNPKNPMTDDRDRPDFEYFFRFEKIMTY
ncbi:MAG: GNAT family N-acetyltransferase [Selenomonadaceae bacterium]|nr:GNAT family N-acetyltransferase [Selenomonadaceae bacterium]